MKALDEDKMTFFKDRKEGRLGEGWGLGDDGIAEAISKKHRSHP